MVLCGVTLVMWLQHWANPTVFIILHKNFYCSHRYKGDPRTCTIFIPTWGSNVGTLGFTCNQNNCGSSGAYVTCIYCSPNVKINKCKTLHGAPRSCAFDVR